MLVICGTVRAICSSTAQDTGAYKKLRFYRRYLSMTCEFLNSCVDAARSSLTTTRQKQYSSVHARFALSLHHAITVLFFRKKVRITHVLFLYTSWHISYEGLNRY